ncbi:MAG: hypothetical protein ACK54X_15405 [Burkholderiales bacterium]|jgi:hypothetical protein
MDPDAPTRPELRLAYGYLPLPDCGRRGASFAAGGAAIAVSEEALHAIRAAIVDRHGRLPRTIAAELARIDEREVHSTELHLLLRALARRDVYVRVALPSG